MTTLTTVLAVYVLIGAAFAVAGYRQHAEQIQRHHLILRMLRGRWWANAVIAGGAACAVVTWPLSLSRALAARGQMANRAEDAEDTARHR